MKAVILFIFSLFVLSTLSTRATPPDLPQQFTTNFTVVAPNYVSDTTTEVFTGFFALDYVNGGGRLEIGGEEFVPAYFHTNFIASPDPNFGVIKGYMFERNLCWIGGNVDANWIVIFPFQIPPNATYMGTVTVNNTKCTEWLFQIPGYGYWVTVDVRVNDPSIVRIQVDSLQYLGTLIWNFYDTVKGPFDPSIYDSPDVQYGLNCTRPFHTSKGSTNLLQMVLSIF